MRLACWCRASHLCTPPGSRNLIESSDVCIFGRIWQRKMQCNENKSSPSPLQRWSVAVLARLDTTRSHSVGLINMPAMPMHWSEQQCPFRRLAAVGEWRFWHLAEGLPRLLVDFPARFTQPFRFREVPTTAIRKGVCVVDHNTLKCLVQQDCTVELCVKGGRGEGGPKKFGVCNQHGQRLLAALCELLVVIAIPARTRPQEGMSISHCLTHCLTAWLLTADGQCHHWRDW